ncbi:hypothetical protein ACN4EG_08100 [Alkalinema pantanalense CENA528]|uniref:hypothetical protein n=1 Tax=Alkalinema pantanalense TaxID=1620705 RepID=UPI003D6DC775
MLSRFLLMTSALLVALPAMAFPGVYKTSTGQTRFIFNPPQIEYITRIQGRIWMGNAKVSGVPVPETGIYQWQGTFQDFRTGGGAEQICTGEIRVTQNLPAQSFSATWKVTGGKACPAIGATTTLSLVDALPRPNARGDFTPEIVNQWNGGTQSSTWKGWQVVSADGALNCRTSPNGPIKLIYQKGQGIQALIDRSGLAMTMSKGAPWLKTTDNCFVRANAQFIQPTNSF